jgi:predicted metal-binding protein
MSKHTLFVCQSCCFFEDHPENEPADGAILLQQLQTCQSSYPELDIRIQPVGCLWDCDRACVVAFSAPCKPTYLFSTLAPESAPALLEFAQQYTCSKTGNITHEKFPEALQKVPIAKVPAVTREAF